MEIINHYTNSDTEEMGSTRLWLQPEKLYPVIFQKLDPSSSHGRSHSEVSRSSAWTKEPLSPVFLALLEERTGFGDYTIHLHCKDGNCVPLVTFSSRQIRVYIAPEDFRWTGSTSILMWERKCSLKGHPTNMAPARSILAISQAK